jgi:hypothetical protein
MLRLFFDETLWDKQGEVGVLMSRFLKATIQRALDGLPQFVAIGFDNHATANGRLIRKVSAIHEFVIPAGEILALRGNGMFRQNPSLLICTQMMLDYNGFGRECGPSMY